MTPRRLLATVLTSALVAATGTAAGAVPLRPDGPPAVTITELDGFPGSVTPLPTGVPVLWA